MEKQVLKDIKESLHPIITSVKQPIVAFDADGTLWGHDIGKSFFEYQVKKGFFKNKILDPHAEFDAICTQSGKTTALLWLAQIQKGILLKTLNQEIQEFLHNNTFKVFRFQKQLIHWLISKNVQVFVVSASLKWVLDYALQGYNIPSTNIIGVETKVQQGIITDQIILPPSIHTEKVQAFKLRTKGVCPCFVAGNTLSDQSLLESSTHLRLVVATTKKGQRNHNSEMALLKIAQNRHWFYINQMPELN